MEEVEIPFIQFAGLPDGAIKRHWANFMFDGQPFRARYFTFGDPKKPTLLMTLGTRSPVLQACFMFKELAKNFNVVAYDSFCFGANSRPQQCSGTQSVERA